MKTRDLMLALVGLTFALLMSVPALPMAEWKGNVFESEMEMVLSPSDRAPFNNEPLDITITSLSGAFVNAADVRFTWSYGGKVSAEGGYPFSRVNQSSMKGTIPGHPGGYTITYRIVAYDEKNTPLTSTQYSYTVIQNGSFVGTDFDKNINLTWGPQEPKNYQGVHLSLASLDELVTISRADLFYTVAIPNQDPVDGVTFFERVNATITSDIIFYPPGSKVTFRVEAYDSYFNKIVSRSYTYEYPRLPPSQPVYIGYIFVQFRDVSRGGYVDQDQRLMVTFSNETYSYTMEARAGIAQTNRTVYQGAYRVEATYYNKTYVWTVNVPKPDGSFSFLFDVNEKTYKVPYEEEASASWLPVIGLLALLALLVLTIFGSGRIKEYYERLAESKKRRRKKGEEEEAPRWYDRILTDAERKERVLRGTAFAVLSLAALSFAPFYPWWMVIILAVFVTLLAVRFPYISLILIALLATAETAYQSREFGWVFLIFSMVTLVGGFFDWRYGYLTFLTVFAAGFGVGFAVPMAAALTISLFMGTAVLITAGIFMLVVAPSGNFQFISLLAAEEHGRSFVTFSRQAPSAWSPVDFANAISSLTNVDTDIVSKVLSQTMTSLVPFVGILMWAAAMVLAYLIFMRVEKGTVQDRTSPKGWMLRSLPGVLLVLGGLVTILWASAKVDVFMVLVFIGCIPASVLAFTMRGLGERSLPLYYGVEEVKSSDVGKKISEMVNFRKADFKDIGGLKDVKREVKNAIMVPLLEPDMAGKYGVKPSKGILLFGPPGCGKTLMLRAVASDLNIDMIGIKCSDVMSKWYGESENLIASLFKEAKARAPCILFLDEIDSIAKRRDFYSTDDVTPRVLSIMLSEMDGMEAAEGVIVVATTNMPDLVDPALMRPGRFDKVIYVPPPDEESRREIMKIHLANRYASKDIDVASIAKKTEGFSGADLSNLVTEASTLSLERALETKKPQPVKMEDVESVLSEIKPSVSAKTLKMYDKLRKEYERKGRRAEGSKPAQGTEPSSDGVRWEE